MMALCLAVQAAAADVNMDDVRRLAQGPVETIFSGAPIGRVSDVDDWKTYHRTIREYIQKNILD
jgi:hypothetical protein